MARHARQSGLLVAGLAALRGLVGCAGPSDAPKTEVATEPLSESASPAAPAGRAARPAAPAHGPAPVTLAEPVLYAFEGTDLVIPLRVEEEAPPDWWRGWRPEVALWGRAVGAELISLRAGPPSLEEAQAAPGWLGPGLQWHVWELPGADDDETEGGGITPPFSAPPELGASGFWALRVKAESLSSVRSAASKPPASGWAEVGGSRAPLVMLATPPASIDAARLPRLSGEARALGELGDMLRPLWADPLQRWRVSLVQDRAPAGRLWRSAQPPAPAPAIEALARQYERRWRAGLAALHDADPDLAAKVVASLSAVVQLEDGTLLPAWPRDDGPAWALLTQLLSRSENPQEKTRAAEAWMAERPASIVWVIDDCGPAGGGTTDTLRATLGVANVSPARFEALASLAGSREATPAVRVEGHSARRVWVDAPRARGLSGAGAAAAAQIQVVAGAESRRFQFATAPVAVTPPGLLMGPLLAELTMDSWIGGVATVPALGRSSAARLERSPSGQWEVFVECRVAESGAASVGATPRDRVRIFFGPVGAPLGVITLEAPAALDQGDRWSARAPVPASAIEPGELLRIGIERRDASGVRSSWPRPMLPGQGEPARRLVRLDRWGGLGP